MNTNRCLVIGCGSHSYSVISIIESQAAYSIEGLVDSATYYDSRENKSGYPVVADSSMLLGSIKKYKKFALILAIGDNLARRTLFLNLLELGYFLPTIISASALIDRTVVLGQGNIIGHHAVVNAASVIGDNNIINTRAIVEHNCRLGSHNHIAPSSTLCGNVLVGNSCLVGAGSVVVPNVAVTDGVIIGANACVTRTIKKVNSTFVGTPAKEK